MCVPRANYGTGLGTRLVKPAICCLVAVVLSCINQAPIQTAAAVEPTVDLKVGKTSRQVFALGVVNPPRAGALVRVRFFLDEGSGFVRIGTKRVQLSRGRDADGDG